MPFEKLTPVQVLLRRLSRKIHPALFSYTRRLGASS